MAPDEDGLGPGTRAVFFDLGDTLLHITPSIPGHYARVLTGLGVPAPRARLRGALRVASTFYVAADRAGLAFETSPEEAARFWDQYNAELLLALGVQRHQAELASRLTRAFWDPAAWRPYPDAAPTLGALRRRGIRLGVISNFTTIIHALCEAHGLASAFEVILPSAQAGSQKPDVSIFRAALRAMGLAPEGCWHVGDNYRTDVLGARAAGIRPVLLLRAGRRPALSSGGGGPAGAGPARPDCPTISGLRALVPLVCPADH